MYGSLTLLLVHGAHKLLPVYITVTNWVGTKPGLWTLECMNCGLDYGLDYRLNFVLNSVLVLPFNKGCEWWIAQ